MRQPIHFRLCLQAVRAGTRDAFTDGVHLTESLIQGYAEGTLSDEQRRGVDAHTLHCDACLQQVVISALSMRVEGDMHTLLFGEDKSEARVSAKKDGTESVVWQ